MDPLRRVRSGEQLRFSADTQNAMLDAARQTKNSRLLFSPHGATSRDPAQVLIQAAATLDRFAPFALGAVATTPGTDSQFHRLPVFASAVCVVDKPFGIMLEPAASGCLGRAVLCGLVPAQVTILDAAHQFAHINATLALESAATGYARIIWAAGTSGSQWCLLQIPGGSSAAIQVQLRSTGGNVPAQGQPYKLVSPEGTPTVTTLAASPVFSVSGTFSDGDPFVIPLASGTGANAVAATASGATPAMVTMSSTGSTDTCADIKSNVLTSAPTGYAKILWKSATSGTVLCLIALPSGGGKSMPDGTVDKQIAIWNNTTKAWVPTSADPIVDWRLNKTTHTYEVCKMSAPTTWVAISDANGGTLDVGVTP